MPTWVFEHIDTIVVGVLSLLGFYFQYNFVEKKIARRDQRDEFVRVIETPLHDIFVKFDEIVVGVQLWQQHPNRGLDPIEERFFPLLRGLNRSINEFAKQRYDVEDGWISFETELIEGAWENLSSCEPAIEARQKVGRAFTDQVDLLLTRLRNHRDKCRPPF